MPRPDDDGSLDDADIRLFESGNFADATIVCGDRTWKVHKVILGSRCKWFKAAFYGNMAEAASGTIVLQEQDAEFVEIMLRFIYTKGVNIFTLRDEKDIPLLCVELFRLADFFLLDKLAETADLELTCYLGMRMVAQDWDKGMLPQTLTEVLESLRCAYRDESTKPLRQMLLAFLCMRKDRYLQAPEAIALIDEIPELSKDLMKTFLSVDLTTNKPNKHTLPRHLPVVEAVHKNRELYLTNGPSLYTGRSKYKNLNNMCVLSPLPDRGLNYPFGVMDMATKTKLEIMPWLAPLPVNLSKVARNEKSSIVQIVSERHGPASIKDSTYIRFLCPADAEHYVRQYCRASPVIKELMREPVTLEQEMRTAGDVVTGDA